MDDPKSQIASIIHALTEGSPSSQKKTLETYFTPNASFTHPLCAVPSFSHIRLPIFGEVNSRWVLWMVYRWYKILSPRIVLGVDCCEFNAQSLTLFIQMHQVFNLFFIPSFLYSPTVKLTTILLLVPAPPDSSIRHHSPSSSNSSLVNSASYFSVVSTVNIDDGGPVSPLRTKSKYLIKHQEDLYQTSEVVKFFWPGGKYIVLAGQWVAMWVCIVGALLLAWVTWGEEFVARRRGGSGSAGTRRGKGQLEGEQEREGKEMEINGFKERRMGGDVNGNGNENWRNGDRNARNGV